MRKLTLFFAIGVVFIAGVYWTQRADDYAKQRCLSQDGTWSFEKRACLTEELTTQND